MAGLRLPNNIDPDAFCIQEVSHPTISPATDSEYGVRTSWTIRAHHAWTIAWQKSDVSTLSPLPPALRNCRGIQLPTWIPGERVGHKALSECESNWNNGADEGPNVTLYVAVIVPCILFLGGAIASCVIMRKRRQRKRAKRLALALAQARAQQNEAQGISLDNIEK